MSFSHGFEMENKFIEYLKNNNYPRESIAAEYSIGKNSSVDIAIIDPQRNIPIIIYELKTKKNKRIIQEGNEQLQKYRSLLKDKTIPAFLVFPKDDEPFFEIMGIDDGDLDTDENGGEKQTTQVVLNYDALLNSRINKKIDTIKKEEKRVIDIFKIESWIIGTITLIIGILSKIGLFTLEAKDITLMGIAIALFLMLASWKY